MTISPEYDVQSARGYSVITFDPKLAECKWGDIERVGTELKDRFAATEKPLALLDLSKLEFMGSAIVALLVRLWKGLQERQGSMIVVSPNKFIKEVLEIAGLAKVWTICDSREEGEKLLKDLVPSHGPTSTVVFAAIFGWVIGGCAVGILMITESGGDLMSREAARTSAIAGAGVAGICGVLTLITGRRFWRAVGVILLLAALGLIATITTRGV